MAKRNKQVNDANTKPLPKSPNPQEKKKSKTDHMGDENKPTDTETAEQELASETAAINLGSRFDKAAPPSFAGGRHIWKNLILSPTLAWTNLAGELKNDATFTSFALDDLFSEAPTSIHNLAQKGKKLRSLQPGAHLTAKGWKALFQEVYEETTPLALTIEGEKIRRFGVRLAMTDPDTIFVGDAIWQLGGLIDRMDTCAWVGAYLHFGALWKNAESWPTKQRFSTKLASDLTMIDNDNDSISSPPELKTTPTPTGLKSSFVSSTKKPGSATKLGWSRQMFLLKPKESAQVLHAKERKSKKSKRKNMSYMKLKTARLASAATFEQEQEYITMLHEALQKLWQIDPDLILYNWEDINAAPLSRNSVLPKNKNSASAYVNGAFLKQGQAAWIRMHVGHNKSIDHFEIPAVKDWFREKDMNVYKEKLQAKITCKAGWLLGSNGLCLNPRDLEAAFELLPELQGVPIEVRVEAIRTEKGKATGVKAAHIHTPWDKALKCRIAMNMVYGKKSTNGYPLGKDMRFIPNILDTRFIVTDKTKMKVKKSVSKQKYFLQKTDSATSYTIIALDYVDPVVGMTLRELLMGLRSNQDQEKTIFLNVDVHMFKSTVTFLFHEDRAQEAMTAIPALPVILEAKFGPTIWGWFSEEAKEHAMGYYWDARTGLKSTEDDRLGEVLGEWGAEWGSDDDDDDRSTSTASTVRGRIEPFKIVTDANGKNQYYDDGSSVGTFKSTCAKVNPATHDFHTATTIASHTANSETTATTVDSPSSSLTGDTWENALQQKMQHDPVFKAYILSIANTAAGTPMPPAHIDAANGSGDGE